MIFNSKDKKAKTKNSNNNELVTINTMKRHRSTLCAMCSERGLRTAFNIGYDGIIQCCNGNW